MKSQQYRLGNEDGVKVVFGNNGVGVTRLTFSSEVRGDAGLRPPPVRPGALILPGWREERNGR